jgi:hypothetical protein
VRTVQKWTGARARTTEKSKADGAAAHDGSYILSPQHQDQAASFVRELLGQSTKICLMCSSQWATPWRPRSSSSTSPLTLSSHHVQGLSHRSMEYVTGRLVPHHRAERHSDWLLFEAAGLTSSSAGELAITAFLQHGYLPPLFSHPSLGDRPKPKPGASRLPPEAGPAICC